MPVKSLTKLSMACAQSFSILRIVEGEPLLSSYFPHLKSLSLSNSTVVLSEMHIEAVPAGLTELELHSVEVQAAPTIRIDMLSRLPPQLQKLALSTPSISATEKFPNFASLVWPVPLRYLKLHAADPTLIYHLPPSIEKLYLTVKLNGPQKIKLPIPTSVLPLTVINVRISGLNYGIIQPKPFFFHPTTFPPNLQVCHLPFAFNLTSAQDWVNLPKSITKMPSAMLLHAYGPLDRAIPNLKVMICGATAPVSIFENLPQNLVELYSRQHSLDEIIQIPPNLQHLCINIKPAGQTPSDAQASSPCDISRLPPNLRSLDMRVRDESEKFSSIDFGYLPRNLSSLTIELKYVLDVKALLAMPRTLKTLSMSVSPESPLRFDSQLLKALPCSLTSLLLNLDALESAWQDWMDTIAQWTELERIQIYVNFNSDPSLLPIDMDILFKLPKSIKAACLPTYQSKLKPEHMERLPKGILTLSLQSIYGDALPFIASDECFAKLPKSLTRLHIPPTTTGLSDKLFDLLPANIIDLYGPPIVQDQKVDFLQKTWEGYALIPKKA
jgi:hypothetical protein